MEEKKTPNESNGQKAHGFVAKTSFFQRLKEFNFHSFFATASYGRTLAIIAILLIVIALPVTVTVLQQRTNTQQHASGYTCPTSGGYCQPKAEGTCDYGYGSGTCATGYVCCKNPVTPVTCQSKKEKYCGINNQTCTRITNTDCSQTITDCHTQPGSCDVPYTCGNSDSGKVSGIFCQTKGICTQANDLQPANSNDKGYGTCSSSTQICCKETAPTSPPVKKCSDLSFTPHNGPAVYGFCVKSASSINKDMYASFSGQASEDCHGGLCEFRTADTFKCDSEKDPTPNKNGFTNQYTGAHRYCASNQWCNSKITTGWPCENAYGYNFIGDVPITNPVSCGDDHKGICVFYAGNGGTKGLSTDPKDFCENQMFGGYFACNATVPPDCGSISNNTYHKDPDHGTSCPSTSAHATCCIRNVLPPSPTNNDCTKNAGTCLASSSQGSSACGQILSQYNSACNAVAYNTFCCKTSTIPTPPSSNTCSCGHPLDPTSGHNDIVCNGKVDHYCPNNIVCYDSSQGPSCGTPGKNNVCQFPDNTDLGKNIFYGDFGKNVHYCSAGYVCYNDRNFTAQCVPAPADGLGDPTDLRLSVDTCQFPGNPYDGKNMIICPNGKYYCAHGQACNYDNNGKTYCGAPQSSTPSPTTCASLKGTCTGAGSTRTCPSGTTRNSQGDASCNANAANEICCVPNSSGGGGNGNGGEDNPTPTPAPKSYGACGGSGEGKCLETTDPGDGHSYSYQTQVPGSQCAINATNGNAPRGQDVYCCTTGSRQYGNCGSSGQDACIASCPASNVSYKDKAADNACAIQATKAGAARNTKVICAVPASGIGLSVSLPAIGTGDFDNKSPKHTNRSFTVAVYASNADITKDKPLFTTAHTSKFSGDGKFGNSSHALDKHQLLDGDYQLTITTNGFMTSQLLSTDGSKTIHITAEQTTNAAPVTLTPGDFNGDNVIDIKDYNAFVGCYGSKAGTSSCVVGKDTADLNDNGDVDGVDYNLWLRSYLATLSH